MDSRNKKFTVWIIGILLCIYAAFKVCTYNIYLSKIKDRNTEPIELSQSLKGRIQKETQGMDKAAVIDYSVKLTAKLLTFSATQGKLGDNKNQKQIVWDMQDYAHQSATMALDKIIYKPKQSL